MKTSPSGVRAVQLYRVSKRYKDGEHCGYSWHPSRRSADQYSRDFLNDVPEGTADVAQFEMQLRKSGVIAFLNSHAQHPDNG